MKINHLLFTCLAAFAIGCQKQENRGPELALGSDLRITSFAVSGTAATINDTSNTVKIELPFGTNFTAVAPTIATPAGATVSPASGAIVNLKQTVKYRVTGGNTYRDYTVTATEKKAIIEFKVAGVTADIDETARTIYALVPNGTNRTSLAPAITLAAGASISPATGAAVNFTNPVNYTVTAGAASVVYKVTVVDPASLARVAFLGTAATGAAITNMDEKIAYAWLVANVANVDYISFDSIKNFTPDLARYKAIWWHEDATQALPAVAFDATVINKLKAYRTGGGSLLLTSYAGQYLPTLGIVPAGKGPNNVFGDVTPWREDNYDWGISFKGYSTHPLFQGLTLTSDKPYPTAYLLAKGTFRLNHSSWWKVNDWGGYGDAAGWRGQTGGIDLAGPEWDENHNSNVGVAEFPKSTSSGATIAIVIGAYDWYNEPDPANGNPSATNSFKTNVERLTKNAIQYLSN